MPDRRHNTVVVNNGTVAGQTYNEGKYILKKGNFEGNGCEADEDSTNYNLTNKLAYAIKTKKGVCADYAFMTDYFMRKMGLTTRLKTSEQVLMKTASGDNSLFANYSRAVRLMLCTLHGAAGTPGRS